MCYYDARIGASIYGGLFNPITYLPFCTYYSFKAFGKLYSLGKCVPSDCDGIYTLAATDGNGKNAVMLANVRSKAVIRTCLEGYKAYIIDEEHHLAEIPFDGKEICLDENQVALLKNTM